MPRVAVSSVAVSFVLLLLAAPSAAWAQSVELFASAGPTVTDAGNSVAAGAGWSPTSRIVVMFGFDRTHVSSRTTADTNGVSHLRGGTLLLGTGEIRVMPLGRGRITPFGLAGLAAGVSRPNVTPVFPDRITNDVRAFFLGGGVEVPLNGRIAIFGEARMMVGVEGVEGIVAVAPVRGGVTWRF